MFFRSRNKILYHRV